VREDVPFQSACLGDGSPGTQRLWG